MPQKLPLEDTVGDIVGKKMRALGIDAARLAAETGIDPSAIGEWRRYRGAPDDAQACAMARALGLDADKLAASAAESWYPPEIDAPDVRRHAQHPHPSNGYVFFCDGPQSAAVLVDPAGDPQTLLQTLRDGAYDLRYILITHKHADHCDAAGAVAAAYPNAKIVMHQLDVAAIGGLGRNAILVRDGEELPLGACTIRMLHTPGHTDGSVCYVLVRGATPGTVFTGDMLFAASVGGAFGDDSTHADILESIRTKLFTLSDATVVMPGHGPPTTIALEKEHNPFFP